MKTLISILLVALLWTNLKAYAPVNEYVSIDGMNMMCRGEKFYSIGMNYQIDIIQQNPSSPSYIAPNAWYGPTPEYDHACTATAGFNAVVSDFQYLKSIGFNTIRLVMTKCDPMVDSFSVFHCATWFTYRYEITDNSIIFSAIEQALEAAEIADIKVILLVNSQAHNVEMYNQVYLDYLTALAIHFKDNPVLMAYDFLNEPMWFDHDRHEKSEICALVKQWSSIIHANAAYQLTTIGFTGPRETEEWDPTILDLDFASFHPYCSQKEGENIQQGIDMVKSEMYWMGLAMHTPWIIGETALSVSSDILETIDQGTPEDQRIYAEQTMEAARDDGACGYFWWLYYDTYETDPDLAYVNNYGILDHNSNPKPVVVEFLEFDPWDVHSAIMPPGYYNSLGFTDYWISGQVIDQNGNPIPNVVVSGNSDPSGGNFFIRTYTNSIGAFILYSKHEITTIWFGCPSGEYKSPAPFPNYLGGQFELKHFETQDYLEMSNITVPQITPATYEATDYINATNVIVPGDGTTGATCTMESENVIRLKTGFHAQNGCSFRAWIGPITPECGATEDFRLAPPEQENVESDSAVYTPGNVRVFPNPTSGTLTLEKTAGANSTCEVVNALGQTIIQSQPFEGQTMIIDLSGEPEGVYFIKVVSGTEVETLRVVKIK